MDLQCRCGEAAVIRTSWTDRNPGRRYAACDRFRSANGCDFFFWVDPPAGERARQIIPGLLRRLNNNEDRVARIVVLEEGIVRAKKREKWLWVVIAMLLLMCFLKP